MVNYLKTLNYFRKITNEGILFIFIATLLTGFFNYIYQIYMGRTLGPEDYGTFGALFAIFYLIGIVSQTIGTSTTKFVSKFVSENKQIGFFIKGSLKRFFIVGLMISIIFYMFTNPMMKIFQLKDQWPIVVLSTILFLTWLEPIISGALRGIKSFTKLGMVNISNSFFKLIFGVIFVILGFGVSGALMGVAIGILLDMVLGAIYLKPFIKPNNPHEPDFEFKNFYSYSIPVMFAMICFSVVGNLDVILAKYFFSATDAGIYTSVSVLGKIVLFVSGAVGMVMFPLIVEKNERKEHKEKNKILIKSLIYTAILGGAVELAYLLFPWMAIKIFGQGYEKGIVLLGLYGLAMLFFSISSVIMNYYLAINDMIYTTGYIIFTFIEVILLIIFNKSMLDMVNVLLFTNFIFLIISIIYIFTLNIGFKYEY